MPPYPQHKARHLVLSDGGRKYMGGVEELISFAESMIAPPFDRGEDDKTNWVDIARQECEVRWTGTTLTPRTTLRRTVDACDIPNRRRRARNHRQTW